jgi:hypothetical protein
MHQASAKMGAGAPTEGFEPQVAVLDNAPLPQAHRLASEYSSGAKNREAALIGVPMGGSLA